MEKQKLKMLESIFFGKSGSTITIKNMENHRVTPSSDVTDQGYF